MVGGDIHFSRNWSRGMSGEEYKPSKHKGAEGASGVHKQLPRGRCCPDGGSRDQGGRGAGRQAEAKLVFGRKYGQELCGAEKTTTSSDKSFWLWQPPKRPPRRDGEAKWHIHAMEHCSAVNRKEVLIHTWRTPKNTQRVISFHS